MKILYFTDTFLPKIDGISISIKNFSEILSQRGYEFKIFCPRYGEGDFSRINDNIHIERFRCGYLPSYPDIKVVLPSPNKIRKVFKEFQPDLVHIHTPGLMGLYAVNAAEKYGVPSIGTYHTLMAEQDMYVSFYRLLKIDKLFMKISRFKKRLKIKDLIKVERFNKLNIRKKVILKLCNDLYNRCDQVISPSHLLKDQLLEYGIKRPITVISNGMDLSKFKGSIRELPQNPKLLHVGRISYEKNCDVIINAFHLIQNQIPNSTLTIIGDGPALNSLKIQAEKLGLKDKISFLGFIDHNILHEYYPKYDVFLTASTMETQGLVILEAIACGLPAIGVKSFAIPELIIDNQNGYIAEPFNVKEIAEKTIFLLSDKEKFRDFSKASIEVASDHELGKSVVKLEEIYKSVASIQDKKKRKTIMGLFT
ncbi:MAG: glycosyltransferase [Leptospiraceae bacterium]|nr:glycosyltransferase [Leptospiraceae bacterium]MCK6381920.1 glycosyltransferase [Leptospiraceae bacterium]NUM41979.1 glycosyltransferase [Leptospiraceae bacterium]